MGHELTGKIHQISDTAQVSDRFKKREFVLITSDNPKYPQFVLFQCTGDRVGLLDEFREGDEVIVEFSVRGREWKSPRGEVKYFNSLDAWRVAHAAPAGDRNDRPLRNEPPAPPLPFAGGTASPDDDIPFATCDIAAEPSPIAHHLRGPA